MSEALTPRTRHFPLMAWSRHPLSQDSPKLATRDLERAVQTLPWLGKKTVHLGLRHPRDRYRLLSRRLSAHDRDSGLGNAQALGKKRAQGRIGFSIDGRRGKRHPDMAVSIAPKRIARGPGLNPYIQVDLVVFQMLRHALAFTAPGNARHPWRETCADDGRQASGSSCIRRGSGQFLQPRRPPPHQGRGGRRRKARAQSRR